jgi:UDPglucose--hexose-1-phosphate uridylyltransferase
MNVQDLPHRRLNLLTGEWVLVSPQRSDRPWLGKIETLDLVQAKRYDPACYLCPGNSRAAGGRNPQYSGTFVFDNDYPALVLEIPDGAKEESNLLISHSERGLCRVGCFSPRHDLTIPNMNPAELRQVVDMWAEQYQSLAAIPWINHVQIFENRGAVMGASNPHPHCQIWANASLPNQPAREQASLHDYLARHQSCLLCDYLSDELERAERVVWENEAFAVVVPFWAVWPFETLLLGKRHVTAIDELSGAERDLLGGMLQHLTQLYDNLFGIPFPYSMGFHQRPTDQQSHPEWHFHAHYYPPLLRSATVQKFMVGYEMLGGPQRDLTPESAAERLREAGRTLDVAKET